MPKNRCKNPYYLIFYYLCNWNVPFQKGTEKHSETEKAFRKKYNTLKFKQ